MDSKKNTPCDSRVDRHDVKLERLLWRQTLLYLVTYYLEHLVFVDETATMTHMRLGWGYSPRGKRVIVKHKSKSSRYTLIAAMGLSKLMAPLVLPRAMNQADWDLWVTKHLLPALAPGSIIIWDNLKLHYSSRALTALREAGHLVLFQSRYSPDLNPIEKAWAKIKHLVRKARPRGAKQLRAAIAKACGAITSSDTDGYFASAIENAWEAQW